MRTSNPVRPISDKTISYLIGSGCTSIGSGLTIYFLFSGRLASDAALFITVVVSAFFPAMVITKLWKIIVVAQENATHDPLSGLHNRRGAREALRIELGTLARDRENAKDGICFSVIMLDIDHFKEVNDGVGGHKAGDDMIRDLGKHIREVFHRKTDICYRYVGDEFAIVLPKTPSAIAGSMAEQLRKHIEELYRKHRPRITISCGVAASIIRDFALSDDPAGEPSSEVAMLVEIADQALYLSKIGGRNRINILRLGEDIGS